MTREEAIKTIEFAKTYISKDGMIRQAIDLALAALRSPTREMVERMRGEWIEDEFAISHCSLCGYEQEEPELITPFCPLCGSPMTDEAVDILLEKLEALKDGKGV